MSELIERHYGPHHRTVTLQGRSERFALQSELNSQTWTRVQDHCLLHVPTAVREKPATLHYTDSPTQTQMQKCCTRYYLPENTGPSKNTSNEDDASGASSCVAHTIESSGVGVFIKEMTDHNISLIGLNRNATTILQITP